MPGRARPRARARFVERVELAYRRSSPHTALRARPHRPPAEQISQIELQRSLYSPLQSDSTPTCNPLATTVSCPRSATPRFTELSRRLWPRSGRSPAKGQVAARRLLQYTIGDEAVASCGRKRVHAWRTPAPGPPPGRGFRIRGGESNAPTTGGATPSTVDCRRPDRRVRRCPTISRWRVCRSTRGRFVFVNLDPHAEPLLDYLDPLPPCSPVPPRTDASARR
jgi:hypothetical protein